MRGLLQFNLENEEEKEKFRCAQKGYPMSGALDSFMEYLLIFPEIGGTKLSGEEVYQNILDMYCSKLVQYDLKDMLEDDVSDILDNYCGDCSGDVEPIAPPIGLDLPN